MSVYVCEKERERDREMGVSPFYFKISEVIFQFIRNNSVMRKAFSIFSLISIVH